MKKIFTLFFFLIVSQVYAQKTSSSLPPESIALTKAIPASPDAAALGKYGSIPVSPYTGVPNVSIPLYTIKSGGISLPISLSYHAGGNKVEESASSAGLGWSLNAAGVITRTVRGLADEESLGFLDPAHSITYIMANLSNNTSDAKLNTYLNRIADGSMDGEADMYNFNFGGYSGRFVMDTYGNVTVIPQQKIKFTFTIDSNGPYIRSFTAVTPDGIKYIFGSDGDGNEAVEKTYSGNSCNPTSNKKYYATSWFIKRIIDPTGHQVNFTYAAENYLIRQAPSQSMYMLYSVSNYNAPIISMPFTTCTPSSSMYGVKLSGITFENGSLSIAAATGRLDIPNSKMIDAISINSDGFSKTYNLYHTNVAGTRLRLDSLVGQLGTLGGSPKEKYSFQYNADIDLSSSTIFYQQDWWGYYNGNTANFFNGQGLLIPAATMTPYGAAAPVILPGADRSSNEEAMLKGMLTRINYPTGGYTIFTYEANHQINRDLNGTSASYPVVHNELAKSNDPNGGYYNWDNINDNPEDIITVVSPGGNLVPVGIYASGLYSGDVNTDDITANLLLMDSQNNTIPGSGVPVRNGDITVYLSPGNYRLILTDGKHHAYPTGTVKYIIDINWHTNNPALYKNYIAGGIRVKQIADYTGTGTAPVNLKTYQYMLPMQNVSSGYIDFLPDYEYNLAVNGGNAQEGIYSDTFFTRTSVSNYPLATTQGSVVGYSHVTEFNGVNGSGGKTEYYYTNSQTNGDMDFGSDFPVAPPMSHDWERGLLLRQVTYKQAPDSSYIKIQDKTCQYGISSQVFTNEIKTAFNPKPSSYEPDFPYYSNQLIDGALVARPYTDYTNFYYLAGETVKNYGSADTLKCDTTVNNYQYDTASFQLNQVQTINSKNEKITQTVLYPNNYTITGSPTGSLRGIKNLQMAGIYSYPIEEITQKSNANGSNARIIKAVLTTYKPTQPLRDSVYQVQSISPLNSFVNSFAGSNNISKNSHYQPLVSFDSYDGFGNIIQEKQVAGPLQSYIWGYLEANNTGYNTYPIAEVLNADAGSIAYTNFESYGSGGYGNWVYGNTAATTDATAPMGVKCYTVSSSNTLLKPGLNTGVTYVVSFWSKSGAAVTVSGGTVSNTATGNTISGWLYHEYRVTGTTSVTIGGSGLVDEVRLYPVNAQMSTYTYVALAGMSSKCDIKNQISYFIYDNVGRLRQVLDQSRNILKDYQYNYIPTTGN